MHITTHNPVGDGKGVLMDSLMTIKEAADYLKLNYMTVYKLARKGKLPASKIGGAWRFKRESLDNWVDKQSRLIQGKVLVVDDDVWVRDILQDIVTGEGYGVVTAESGEKALQELKNQNFDLVFLDLVLPGVSGVEVFQSLKENDKKPAVVIVTGYGDTPVALEVISMGPLLILRKPFQVSDVVEVLNLVMKVRP